MTTPVEGLYARLYLSATAAPGPPIIVAELRGIEWTSRQTKRRWYAMGTIHPSQILRGIIEHDGRARHAFITPEWIGTLQIGTYVYLGSLTPRGATTPFIMGTVEITDISLNNMEAENEMAVIEDIGFIMYNLTFKS